VLLPLPPFIVATVMIELVMSPSPARCPLAANQSHTKLIISTYGEPAYDLRQVVLWPI